MCPSRGRREAAGPPPAWPPSSSPRKLRPPRTPILHRRGSCRIRVDRGQLAAVDRVRDGHLSYLRAVLGLFDPLGSDVHRPSVRCALANLFLLADTACLIPAAKDVGVPSVSPTAATWLLLTRSPIASSSPSDSPRSACPATVRDSEPSR